MVVNLSVVVDFFIKDSIFAGKYFAESMILKGRKVKINFEKNHVDVSEIFNEDDTLQIMKEN